MAITGAPLLVDEEAGGSKGFFSQPTVSNTTLQKLIRKAHSLDVQEQKDAAVELAKLVEKRVFPPSSFGPMAHALCRLIPSDDRTIVAYAARAVKVLLMDDQLRPQASVAGIPKVLVDALQQWEEEVPCLRELLGAVQTLCCDSASAKAVVEAGFVETLVELLDTQHDVELQHLTAATAANLLSFADTAFLTDEEFIDAFGDSMEALMEMVKTRDRALRCYTMAALANATAHPVLAGRIKDLGGLQVIQRIEEVARNNVAVTLGGVQIVDCAETAVSRLSGKTDLESGNAQKKYTFKWGNKGGATLELILCATRGARMRVTLCAVLWLSTIFFLIYPVLGIH